MSAQRQSPASLEINSAPKQERMTALLNVKRASRYVRRGGARS